MVIAESDSQDNDYWDLLPENVKGAIEAEILPKLKLGKAALLGNAGESAEEIAKRPHLNIQSLPEWVFQEFEFQKQLLEERKVKSQREVERLLPMALFEDFADVYESKSKARL